MSQIYLKPFASLLTSSPSYPLSLSQSLSSHTHFISLYGLSCNERKAITIFLWYEIYSYLMNKIETSDKECSSMFDHKLIRFLLVELINEGENLEGIHHVTRIPLDILNDIILELNINPSIGVAVKIIEYYILIKRSFFTEFVRKIFQCMTYHEHTVSHKL